MKNNITHMLLIVDLMLFQKWNIKYNTIYLLLNVVCVMHYKMRFVALWAKRVQQKRQEALNTYHSSIESMKIHQTTASEDSANTQILIKWCEGSSSTNKSRTPSRVHYAENDHPVSDQSVRVWMLVHESTCHTVWRWRTLIRSSGSRRGNADLA